MGVNREGSVSPQRDAQNSENKISKWANKKYLELKKQTKDRIESQKVSQQNELLQKLAANEFMPAVALDSFIHGGA